MKLSIAATLSATAVAQNATYNTIRWGPCPTGVADKRMVCGQLLVPLDYTNNRTNEPLTLQLTKWPATKQPSRGSILVNFGGPGEDARSALQDSARTLESGSGGEYDLIGIDPRGTGDTIPFSCYQDETMRRASREAVRMGFGNASDVAPGRLWAEAQVLANDCASTLANTTGSLVGTAFVARDFIKVVDALGEDGLLRYWGLSYGSVLGSTIAAMFPDRIDRMVMDGIANIHEWQRGIGVEHLTDIDKTFKGFLAGCVAYPDNCDLAHDNRTAAVLEASIYQLIDSLKYAPLTVGSNIIGYEHVKGLILLFLRDPNSWPDLAKFLDAFLATDLDRLASLLATDLDRLASLLSRLGISRTSESGNEAFQGIRCADNKFRTADPRALAPLYAAQTARSRIGGDFWLSLMMQCARWPMVARERYEGDFRARTRHPVLFIGNSADPTTPLASAVNASAGFEGSVVLEHKGYGHTSMTQCSNCTMTVVREYFTSGVLPAPGTTCEVNHPAFARVPKDGLEAMAAAAAAAINRRVLF